MTVRYVVLAEEIEDIIGRLVKFENKIQETSQKLQKRLEDKDVYLDSIAINLHSFYTGIENIFADIASKVDGELPDGEKWHSDLLRQMATSLNETDPRLFQIKPTRAYGTFWHFGMLFGTSTHLISTRKTC